MTEHVIDAEAVFLAALEKATASERAAYVEGACATKPEILQRVRELLDAHEKSHGPLDVPPEGLALTAPAITERPGTMIGPYKLMEQIGEGGMGLVFVAEQLQPVRRKVALKIIRPGMDTRDVIARFEAERQALALMDHPNIAKVLDAGATDSGRPYFVMELVKGIPITDYCDQNQLTPRERLALFVDVCQAVQHAHTKGVIHRDLKPSNVMIAPHDGKPVVKVIDFGVAKAVGQALTDKTIYTRLSQMIGTPLYMSPEQAEINALDVDTRSDVYGLGVLLYELLTGTTPFDRQRLHTAAFDEIRRIIREEEPPKPSTRLSTLGDGLAAMSAKRKMEPGKLSALFKGDLDWIVMKALEKDRTRRYDTANAMAADVRRFLSDEVVEARPPSAWYRFRKMARRNKAVVTTAALVAAALVLGIVGTTLGLVQAIDAGAKAVAARDEEARQRLEADDQRKRAVTAEANARTNEQKAKEAGDEAQRLAKQEKEAREQSDRDKAAALQAKQEAVDHAIKAEWRLYAFNIAAAQREWESKNVPLFNHFLDQCHPDFRGWEHDYLYSLANQNEQTLLGHSGSVWTVAFSPDGKRLASASRGESPYSPGELKLWDVASGQVIRTLYGLPSTFSSVAFSADGKRLAIASKRPGGGGSGYVELLDAASGNEILTFKGHPNAVNTVAFSPDGKRLASAGEVRRDEAGKGGKSVFVSGRVILWDAASGRELLTIDGHKGVITSVVFSPDGKSLASAGGRTVRVWDAETGKELLTVEGHKGGVTSVAFSPDGKRIASASGDNTVKLWNAASGEEVLTFKGHTNGVSSVAFSPDGKRLASASADGTVTLWDAASGQAIQTFKGHKYGVSSVAFSPDGKRLASGGLASKSLPAGPGEVKVWAAAGGQEVLTFQGHTGRVVSVAFSPDGKRLASESWDETVKLWDAASGQAVLTLKGNAKNSIGTIVSIAFTPDGKRLASSAKLWDVASGQEVLTFKGPKGPLALSPDGKRLAAPSGNGTLKLWDASSGQAVLTFKGNSGRVGSLAFSPDGKRLASTAAATPGGTGDYKVVKLWDASSGKEVLTFKGHTRGVSSVAFSPDGKRLASAGGFDQTVKLWDAASGQEILTLKGHTHSVDSVAFSPDGKRLASASLDKTVKLWDVASGQEVLTLKGHTTAVICVAFSPDGKRLASASSDGTILIWDASKSMKELEQK